jgi:anti-sigma B factor antagonist
VSGDEPSGLRPGLLDVVPHRHADGTHFLCVSGELDLSNYERLEAAFWLGLLDSSARRVIVDLSECAFIDSTGVMTLLRAYRSAQKDGAPLLICGATGQVLRVLEITGLAEAIPLLSSRPGARGASEGLAIGA